MKTSSSILCRALWLSWGLLVLASVAGETPPPTNTQVESADEVGAKLNVTQSNDSVSVTGLSTNTMQAASTNLVYTSKGRQRVAAKLDSIVFESFELPQGGLPLSEVVRLLNDESRKRDPSPNGKGVNFIINNNPTDANWDLAAIQAQQAATNQDGGAVGGFDAQGNPIDTATSAVEATDLTTATIKLNPGLHNVRLADILDVITKVSDVPIKYSIEDYSVIFSLRGTESAQLFARSFKLDNGFFVSNIEQLEYLRGTNIVEKLRELSVIMGVELDPPKSIFFDEDKSILIIRATEEDLDVWEQAVQVLDAPPHLVRIDVKFVKMPEENVAQFFPNYQFSTNDIRNLLLTGILTEPQVRASFRSFETNKEVNILNMPEVTTLSGRQAQVQMMEKMNVVTGVKPEAWFPPGVSATNDDVSAALVVTNMSTGPMIDLVPYVSANGYSMQLSVIPSLNEFLGYDNPRTVSSNLTTYVYVNGEKFPATGLPLPHFRLRKITTVTEIWDGQTLVLYGLSSQQSFATTENSHSESSNGKRRLLVFITPTIIDAAGNRVHSDEDVLAAQKRLAVQPK